MRLSRRSILLATGAGVASSAWPASAATAPQRVLTPANYADVQLLEGPMLSQFQAQHATLMAMDEDALLKPFRQKAGLPAPGPDLGGWYNWVDHYNVPDSFNGFIPGHCFGQYVSGLARAYAITGDEATRAKVARFVANFAPTITPRFYEDYALPAYTLDKTSIGLIDAYRFAGCGDALTIYGRAVDAALPHLPEHAVPRPESEAAPHANVAFGWDETYTLPENFYLAYRLGAGARYHTLAQRYLLDRTWFDPLAAGQNVIAHHHAYSHLNSLNSAMQSYLVDGNEKHLRAAKNGYDFILAQSFATGGWGPNEGFVEAGSTALGDSLTGTHASFEAPCGCYGQFKLVRYMISATGESQYGDSMERLLYNAIMGALPMKPDGTAFYYADYNMSGSKFYHDYKCTCCSGTIGQVLADYGVSSYFTAPNGVAINLYHPSQFRWRRAGRVVTFRQTTTYPLSPDIEIAVNTPTEETFSVSLRIPAWAGPATRVAVNGRALGGDVQPGRFYEIHRTWRRGDRITLSLDMPLRQEAVDDKHADRLALTQGPLALFVVGDAIPAFRRAELMAATQTGAEWRVSTAQGAQTFKPYFAINAEKTRLYQDVTA
ncbi:MAG: beta-L-arabinofuranosidase domain-containing protein [Pseudomonadota bacterium]